MSWNYRVVKTTIDGEDSYGIHEVYYDNVGAPHMYSESPCSLYSETLGGLKEELERFRRSFDKPILSDIDFKGHEKL